MLPIMPLPAPPCDGDQFPLPPSQVENDSKDEHMQEADDVQKNPNSTPESIATHTRTIGIIHPPSDIRNIIEKTASFVAKCGSVYEKRIIGDYAGQQKFNFLHGSDPYHAYYQHRLSELRSHNQATKKTDPGLQVDPETTPSAAAADGNDATKITDPSGKFRPVKKVLEPPEAEQYTIQLPEGITGEELNIIKLTAQFVALKGESFLTGLTSRENNPQFHFLKPTHNMNMFFKSLVYAYLKVLMPPKGLIDKLKNSVTDITAVLERCWHQLEWERAQVQARQKMEDEIEQEKQAMAKIDWHDSVVVETIDFADDDLPRPVTLEEVERWSKMAVAVEEEIVEPGKEVEMEMDEEEVKLVQEGMRAAALEENTNVVKEKEENEPRMRIVKNYKRPEERLAAAADRNAANIVVSPITGELIPINEISEHMRISLIDPKYKEQKERMFAKIRETTLAQDDEILRNIVGLARTRPDIFGTTEEEVSNAVKAEIEAKNDELKQQAKQVIWDGHKGSIGHTAAQVRPQNADQTNGRNLPRPAAPPPRPGVPFLGPLPPPHGLAFNLPSVPPSAQYSAVSPLPRPGMVTLVHPPLHPMQTNYSQQQPYIMNRPPLPTSQSLSVSPPSILVPPPPGSQFAACSFMPEHGMPIAPAAPMSQAMQPPPPPEEAPTLPEEPEPKRQKLDSLLVPEDQFLAQHPGPVHISVAVPNVDEGNLKGQILEISVESLSESVSSLKEKIAGEIQLPANKQKLSGKACFFKDSLSLAYYNVGGDEMLSLSLRERGGRKR